MDKREFFLKAMHAGEYKRRAWVISAFSLVKEIPDAWKKDPYPYRVVQTPAGHFFIDPENGHQLTKIDGALGGLPPLSFKDRIELHPGQVPNVYETVETNYGNVLFNFTCLIFPFGNRVKFLTGRVDAGKLEQTVLDRTVDRPKNLSPEQQPDGPDAKLYTDEYIKFCEAMFHMAGYTQLCVPAKSEKEMVMAPGMKELRQQLLEKNKDRLHDPAVIAAINKELIDFDKAYLKDDSAAGFLGPSAGKSYGVVRSKLFNMHGMEMGFGEGTKPQLVQNSLSEGWDIEKFPIMMDSLRSGSYFRGAETMLGGEAVKWLLRASTNMAVVQEDCGTSLGLPMEVTKKNLYKLPGFTAILGQGVTEKIKDAEQAGQYLGKQIMLRSPMFCKLDKTDYCATCVGERLSINPTALSAAISEYGSTFMLISMKKMHGTKLETHRMNYQTALF
jgi:hypothetical protein